MGDDSAVSDRDEPVGEEVRHEPSAEPVRREDKVRTGQVECVGGEQLVHRPDGAGTEWNGAREIDRPRITDATAGRDADEHRVRDLTGAHVPEDDPAVREELDLVRVVATPKVLRNVVPRHDGATGEGVEADSISKARVRVIPQNRDACGAVQKAAVETPQEWIATALAVRAAEREKGVARELSACEGPPPEGK